MYKKSEQNTKGIMFEELRKKVDTPFVDLHDELSKCYYDFWKKGKSHPFVNGDNIYDVQATPEESKALFDKLHGLIGHLHAVAMNAEYEKTGDVDEKFERMNPKEKVAESNKFVKDLEMEGIKIDV